MLKTFWILLNLFIIVVIFLRIPKDTVGLSSFATKSSILGSVSSTEQTLNYLIGLSILAYLLIGFYLNIN